MAISAPHYHCLQTLHRRGELPQGGSLLEIGEANWYGDIEPPFAGNAFEVVKQLYAMVFGNPQTDAIDFHGPTADRRDLNTATVNRSYDTVINHGTAEHIFNVANVYRLMHDACKPGGLLIHESPFTGWIDHGFYTIQPTLYYDLAAANQYDLRFMALTHIEHQSAVEIYSREQLLRMASVGGVPNNSMLYVAMRKTQSAPFAIPMQGFYAQSISREAHDSWRNLR